MNSFSYKTIYLLCIACVLCSCKKFITVNPPATQITVNNVFTDDVTATSAIVGLYSNIMGGFYFLNGSTTLYPALSADELYRTTPDLNIDAFTSNAIPPESNIIRNDLWGKAYSYIYQINACLEGLTSSQNVTAAAKQQLTGEMKFMRGLCYFYLVNLFGDVPLVLNTDYIQNASLPRTPVAQVYDQIIKDLKDAETSLTEKYVTAKFVRPNKFCATALLARVYLYQKDWNNADAEASKVIGSGMYEMVSDVNKIFLAGSHEIIWQLMPVIPGLNTEEGITFIPYSSALIPTYALTDNLINSFEPADKRKAAWLDSNVVNSHAYYYPFKCKVRGGMQVTEYNIVLRFAEQFLIRAEARAQENKISDAISDVNVIRQRAGLQPLMNIFSQADCLSAIMHENQIEFFAEWGHRWFDLKRTGRADAVLSVEKPQWQATDVLYPIPFLELQTNTSLIQNPGY